jgi:membrane-associated phospholipid phosphatase
MKRIANIISVVGNPLYTIPVFVLIVMFGNEDFSKASLISFLIIGCIFIPVILWMYIKSKNGTYTNFDVSDKNQRKSLFWFAFPLVLIITVFMFVTNQSRNLSISMLFALILVVTSQITNFFIKSSLHVSLNIFLSSLIFTVNYKMGIAVLLFTGLLIWSRLKLERHTVKEVFTGFVIGLLISLIMLITEGYLEY